jgi:anti-sigma28 factor (negative regulator of flagellin synthesis)
MQVGSSSLANSLFSTDTLSKIGQLGKTDSAKPSAAAEAARKAELSKSSQRAVLDEIREKGIYAWAQEQKLEKLKEKIEAEVKSANPDADPATVENEVARLVKEAMEQALKTESAEAAKRGEPAKPMIIDISV